MPGKMRSDCQEIPDGFSKEDADKAETMEAQLASTSGEVTTFAAPGCQVYWPAPYEVCGAIRDKYNSLGGPNSFLLYPISNELTNPDGVGKRSTFQNGPIYWSPWGGAHPVVNHFFAAWQRNGWEGGVLGYPTSDELVNPDGIGRRQYFDGGTVYWKLNEAYYVAGAIRDRWGEIGWEQGLLGYPVSDETATADGVGRFNRFDNGSIYWHPGTGAYEVTGQIHDKWAAEGYETGPHGYPIEPPRPVDGTVRFVQQFQHGEISGYADVIAQIADLLQIGDLDEIYRTGKEVIEEAGMATDEGFHAVLDRVQGSYDEVQEISDGGNSTNCDFVPPGNDRTNRGDVFFSDATSYRVANHGHNGIFVRNDHTGGTGDIWTVEAVNEELGVRLLKGDARKGVCRPIYLSVNTDNATRDAAAAFAEQQVGKGYNGNFLLTRTQVYDDSYNCSQLVWAAYKHASGGGLDISERYPYQPPNFGVYPIDILKSHNTRRFE
ncbi:MULTISPECIES: YiiX/YebB-like N1pC/P60 family cysteine hydrolase [unclassified Nocardia]|uniref:YiiX/YebB-like N1pC/P60 family cysteine hydrolase n=1 Tax=unclassified Nocardia TaxID=2637762 RepID=UPI0024A9638C|nr:MULTISPECIES: YiiX/YebB-like N1pC/P60 family cysteine hydrolase [unclassified Nocardia]